MGSAVIDVEESVDGPVLDEMRFLVNSATRIRVLAALTDGMRTESALTESLDEPQATIHQNLQKLTERDLVEAVDGAYRATWRGEALVDVVADYGRRVASVGDLEPLLEHVPVSAVNVRALEDAEVTATRPNRPEATIERAIELVESASEIRVVTPYIVPRLVDLVCEHIARDHPFELVTTEDAATALFEDHPDGSHEDVADSQSALYASGDPIPFAMLFVDDRLVLGGFDETGILRATVETTDPDALAWAEQRYREHRAAASRVRVADL